MRTTSISTQHLQSHHARGSSKGIGAEGSSFKLYVTKTPIREHTAGTSPTAHLVADREGTDNENPCKFLEVSASQGNYKNFSPEK